MPEVAFHKDGYTLPTEDHVRRSWKSRNVLSEPEACPVENASQQTFRMGIDASNQRHCTGALSGRQIVRHYANSSATPRSGRDQPARRSHFLLVMHGRL